VGDPGTRRIAPSSNRFDPETLLSGILDWVRTESPSYDTGAVNRMLDKVEAAFAGLPAKVERIPGRNGYADVMRVALGSGDAPGTLVLGHIDTVHPIGTLEATLPIRREGDRAYGPGILDMKGGLYLAVHAVRELYATDRPPRLPITFLIIPDEEVGSPSTRDLIEDEARQHRYVLVPEPAREGKIITGRHAFARYSIRVRGHPAHAGADNRKGRSAISRMAVLIQDLEAHSEFERGLTYSVGIVRGGTFVNVIPTECEAQVLCVAPDEEALADIAATMATLNNEYVSVERGPERPLFRPSAGGLDLFERAREIGQTVGLELEHGQFGGGSDGNFTGALGIPTLDGLGPVGGGPHTFDEHILVSSLSSRCQVLARLLETLD